MCSCSGRRAEGWRRRGSVRCSSPSCGTWPRAAPSSPHCARIGIERSRTAPSFSFAPSAASAMISCPPSRRSSLSRTVSGASSPAITWKSSSPKARPPQRADRQAGSARDLGEARGLRQRAHGGGAAPVRRRGKTLSPNADKLDDAALVALALALDGLGRGSEALKVLEDHYRKNGISSLDALGVLGGRYKRQWLAGRVAEDLKRARAL